MSAASFMRNALKRLDSWTNMLSGVGADGKDRRLAARIEPNRYLDHFTLETLYSASDTVSRICDLMAREMLREDLNLPTDKTGALADALETLGARATFEEALSWSALHGGALVLMGIDDNQPLAAPVDFENVAALHYLTTFTRWEARVASYYTDPNQPNFGRPQLYEIWPQYLDGEKTLPPGQNLVHESRCIRFDAVLNPRRILLENGGWGPGVIDRVYNIIRDFDASYDGVALLLTEYVQNVYKIADLAEKLDGDEEGLVLQRLASLDLARSIARAIPIDADRESFERISPQGVAGLADLVDRMDRRLSAATGIPVQLLMGETPGGLGGDGGSDNMTANFYNVVAGQQNRYLRPAYGRLLPILSQATGTRTARAGRVPFTFKSLWKPSDKERAHAHFEQSTADIQYVQTGVLTPAEVAKSRFGTGTYSLDTTLDTSIADADRAAPAPPAAPVTPNTTAPEPKPAK